MNPLVELAAKIATDAHKGQTRWDGKTPYISHPAAVAKAVEKKKFGPEYVAAAWLHDVLEDTHVTALDLAQAGIPQDVISAVEALTKNEGESYLKYIQSVGMNHIASVVKREDIRNNMSDLDRKKRGSMYDKYEIALWYLEQEF